MLACTCLNIIIEPETNDLLKVARDTLDLTEFEKKDSFFNQDIQQTSKLNKFHKKIPALVTSRLVGSRWIIYQCINCNMNTHAIYRENGAAFILISSKLVDNDGVLEIKSGNQYSPIFDIKIMESYTSGFGKASEIASSDSEAIISSLRQRVNEFINKETVAVENRIRKFTEDQYKALNEYRDRVFKEQHVLKMKILEHKLDTSADNELSTNMTTNLPQNKPKSSNTTVPDAISNNNSPLVSKPKSIVNNKSPSKKRNSSFSYSRSMSAYENSYDAEIFFPLEDMQDEPTLEQSDFEDSDQEDIPKDDSSDSIQRQKQSSQLAKSLPVNIPVFMSAYQNHLSEDNDDDLPDESMDIAASIKALAKSIQGGTVFGELPRSRFSSQI
ncbi:Proline-rich AKT1 substrate 1 [Popillia japonica]|uniref:Proline-rich AKT1 substrate 1 n=1 Tax=Popillia japonica TaxID=7064 RepID=A0AAW1HSG4_POPJA